MTLQQLEYVLAVAEYRHFVRAAEACGITQSTLSSIIKKLEEELDLTIFDRNSHPVKPTMAGEEIIKQARVVLFHAKQLQEQSMNERKRATGNVHLGITPTIAPYIIPKLFKYLDTVPDVTIQAYEIRRSKIIAQLKSAELDMAIMSYPKDDDELLEIPLYKERLFAYVSPQDPLSEQDSIDSINMPEDRLWTLQHEICFQLQLSEFCDRESMRRSRYEAGSVASLLHIVNENGGFTVIPELHIPMLRDDHRCNLRPMVNPEPIRQVSLFIRKDYVREGLLNVIVDGIKTIIPPRMLNEHIAKFPVRL